MGVRKKVAVIGVKGLPGFGGSARSMESLIGVLKDNYEFTVYAIESHTTMKGWVNGYHQIVFKSNRNRLLNTFFYYWKCLFHCLFKGEYDLVHLNHGSSGYIVPFLRLKYPVLLTLRGVYDKERRDEKFSSSVLTPLKVFQSVGLNSASALVSVSTHELSYIKRHTRRPVLHIPNGVGLESVNLKQGVAYDEYILFAAARIYSVKGCDIFLTALQEITYKGKVLIIGDLSHDFKYRELLYDLLGGLDVTLIDLVREKALLMAYLKKAKLFVFPSRMEGMSNMLLEAVAMGCPVICSDIRANTGIFSEADVTFFRSGDPHDLGEKIAFALRSYDLIVRKAIHARRTAEEKYSWEKIACQYSNLYEVLIKQRGVEQLASQKVNGSVRVSDSKWS